MINQTSRFASDRGLLPALSTHARYIMTGLSFGTAVVVPPVIAQTPQTATATAASETLNASAVAGQPTGATAAPPRYMPMTAVPSLSNSGAISNTIYQWKTLQATDAYPFGSYASFLVTNPGWPGETAMRKAAEKQLRPGIDSPSQIISFFRRFAPLTAAGYVRFADALSATGAIDEAKPLIRKAWASSALAPQDEARILSAYGAVLTPADHDARMDQLLWSRYTSLAMRQLGFVSAERRPMFELRIALLTRAVDAASRLSSAQARARSDAGLIADISWWYRQTGNLAASRQELAASRRLVAPPIAPGRWLAIQYEAARNAANDFQWETVWNIARQVSDTYPAGTVIRDRSFEERDIYTSLTWLGGMTALTKRARPADAIAMFDLYAGAAKSPQTQAKGLYWAGRACEAAGERSRAAVYYERAAAFFDQFHGQLANEKLGRSITAPPPRRTLELSGAQRSSFDNSSVVKAAAYLGNSGQWQDQTQFIRAIASNVQSDADHFLASELATRLNRPDLGVLVGRSAREDGLSDYIGVAFPQIKVPDEHSGSWTFIHAITRQESQFDREARSPVGARGLMQLMPGTARETSPSAGVSYDLASLTADPQYNIRLGSTYFGQLMDRYGGSYVLSVAAYNAGPGNVNKWLRANGDPRLPGADVLAWIEAIPLTETRGYVQRVLENAVVYGALNPARAPVRSKTPLSVYLGKSQPG